MLRVQHLGPRARRTHAAILTAAETVFAEKGFAAARLEDVAAQVEIRRASLVYYFRDKRALYEAVIENLLGELLGRYRAVLDGPEPVPEKLDRIVTVWVRYLGERPALSRLVLREAAESSPSVSAVFADRIRPLGETVTGLIAEGQRRGLFGPGDPLRILMAIAGAKMFHDTFARVLDPTHTFGPHDDAKAEVVEVLHVLHRLIGTRPLRAVPSPKVRGGRRPT